KSSSPADREHLVVRFGDEAEGAPLDSLARVNIISSGVGEDSQLNYYTDIHTYPGIGNYIISMEDPNRNGGVINMDESISQVFYIESMLSISAFGGHNNSVSLLYPAKDEACTGSPWEHNPGAFDIDGDSLVYSLIPCKGLQGLDIPSWVIPNLIPGSDGISDTFTINPVTGTIEWDSPVVAGEYNIAIKIEEYRNQNLVGYVIRDMQINVLNCQAVPPVVTVIEDTCVIAGQTLELEFEGIDNNSFVILEAVGAPITELENLAEFDATFGNPATAELTWTPQCSEVRPSPYQVLVIGSDNTNTINLIDISEVSIKVIAPKVEDLVVEPNGLSFDLSWTPHICPQVIAYKIYKRNGFFGYVPSFCETGVPAFTGYELIETISASETTYNDSNDIDFGSESCYMVVALLENGSESIASDEVCASIDLIIPVITKVSIGVTDISAGIDTIHWAPPVAGDTILLTAPYTFKLFHSEGFNSVTDLIYESESSPFIGTLPRTFIHTDINTVDNAHAYLVRLEDSAGNTVDSRVSSSQFLTITPDDNEMLLTLQNDHSWQFTSMDIFKLNELGTEYEFLANTTENTYLDTGLINNVQYCYYVIEQGTFNSALDVLPNPTINYSQRVCSSPVDLTAPCAPDLTGVADCEFGTVSLAWNNPNESCADDVVEYRIYFKPFTDSEYELLETITDPAETTFEYVNEENITGCFYVTALDSILPGLGGIPNQNESIASFEICSESCPDYELPNVFSPQGDSFNDFFQPFPYTYVDSIDLRIYNRWGTIVFETTDPNINWDGLKKDSGEISSDGVYFYEITIFTSRLTGVFEETRSGNIILLDGKKQSTD
ncbi:MAG: gliding motility-associated C-terminal domain-containing protein, partial [Flavobacteriales bacterium]